MRWFIVASVLAFGCASTATSVKQPERSECTKGSVTGSDLTGSGSPTADRWSRMSDKNTCTNTTGGSVSSEKARPHKDSKDDE